MVVGIAVVSGEGFAAVVPHFGYQLTQRVVACLHGVAVGIGDLLEPAVAESAVMVGGFG